MFGKILEKTALISMKTKIVLGFKEKKKKKEFMFVVDANEFNLNTIDFTYEEKQELAILINNAKKCKHESTIEQIPMSCERTKEVIYCPKCNQVQNIEIKKSPITDVLMEIRNLQNEVSKDQLEVERKKRQVSLGIEKINANRKRIEELSKNL